MDPTWASGGRGTMRIGAATKSNDLSADDRSLALGWTHGAVKSRVLWANLGDIKGRWDSLGDVCGFLFRFGAFSMFEW